MALGRSLWAALFVLHALGCVLVVPPVEDAGGHCQLTGSTECATCLRTSCQTSIDACCDDKSCAGEDGHSAILDALDECGTGNATSCADGIGKGDSTAAASVRSCVTGTCKQACLGDAAVKIDWSCTVARSNDNACATCVYDKCASALDECCTDSSCSKSSDLAEDMGACTGGDAPGCSYSTMKSTSGFEGKVRACILQKCGTTCMDTGRTHQSCQLLSGGSYCACQDAEKSSGPDCSAAALGGGSEVQCVLGNKGCTCGSYGCSSSTSSSRSCSCSFGRGGGSDSTSCRAPSGSGSGEAGRCCGKFTDTGLTCTCDEYTFSCSSTEFSISSCDLDVLMNRVNPSAFVTKCSL